MKNSQVIATVLSGIFCVSAGYVMAADAVQIQKQEQDKTQLKSQLQEQDQERIFGRELMTKAEMDEYRLRMRKAKSVQEQEKLRKEHHERMLVRAGERGVTLPEEPPMGAGPGAANTDPGGKGKEHGQGGDRSGGQGGQGGQGGGQSGGNR